MTGDLFTEWVKKLASSFRAQDRKVVTTCSPAADAEIVAQILDPNFKNDDDDEFEDNVNALFFTIFRKFSLDFKSGVCTG